MRRAASLLSASLALALSLFSPSADAALSRVPRGHGNGSNCDAGQYARGVDASGNAEGCTPDSTGTDSADDLSNNSIDDLSDVAITSAAAAQVLIRNSGNTAWVNVAISGDITVAADGTVTIGSDKVALGNDTTGNYVAGATASGGLALTGTEGGTLGVLLPAATNGLSATTSSGSGLELLSGGLAIIQGCPDGAPLEWNETSDVWQCGTDNSGGGTANILDLGDDGGNDSTDLVEIATTGDTNGVFTEPSADKLLIDASKDWPKADTADDLTCTNCIGATEVDGASLESEVEGVVDLQELQGAVTDSQVPDTITASNYLLLAGGTLTGDILLDNQADVRLLEADANGSNFIAFQAPSAITSDVTITLENDSNPIPDSAVGNGVDDTGTDSADDLSNNVIDDLSDVAITSAAAAHILIRNAGNTAWENVAISGDAGINASGALEVTQADALESNGGNCSAGSGAGGVSASGVAEDCADYIGAGDTATVTATIMAADSVGESELIENMNFAATGFWDFGGGTLQIPNGTSLPGTCAVGDAFMDTDATSGQRFYLCQSANTWVLQGDGGGGGFDSTTVHSTTWSNGSNASNVWTNDVSGTDTTLTWSSALATFSHGVTVSGLLTADGGVTLGSGDDLNISAPTDLIVGTTTSLGETTSATDSGAFLVGANDEFTNSASTTVQGVLNDLDNAISQGCAIEPCAFLPQSGVLDDSNPPALTVFESTGAGTPRRFVADFDPTTDQIIYFSFVAKQNIPSGNWTWIVHWAANDTGANEDAIWGLQMSCTSEGDADSMAEDAAGALEYAAENVNATEANRLNQTPVTMANVDSVAAGDYCTVALRRDADNTKGDAGGDGLTSDARLMLLEARTP